ncbi:hypothetical protein DY000_02016030 [Brassica cretica]|uniref:Uncharacterized protein n=1 Tax=Brassica cretica TaxID=69181 RepID=A0ABQ7D9T6_BRACR|nr:hypothetical protein DY000_02016030 [Brassica cretica]
MSSRKETHQTRKNWEKLIRERNKRGYQFFLNYGREEKIDKERWTRKKKAKRVTEKNYSKEEAREVETANSCEEEETLNSCKEENTQLKKNKRQKNLKNM